MSLRTYIDGKLIGYAWYRKFQARRARKLAAKKTVGEYDGIETYEPSDIIRQENERYEALLAERKKREEEYDARVKNMNSVWAEVFERYKSPDGSITAENQRRADAEFDKLFNERYPEKG